MIPDYVLESIAFASPALPVKMKASMISYRIKSLKNDETKIDAATAFEQKHAENLAKSKVDFLSQYIEDYSDFFPEDSLTKFFNLL